jgi:hypothetical protein
MQTAFYVLAAYGFFFFVVQRRHFDFVSVGFIGQLIYFMPGFSGYVMNPYFTWVEPSIPIADETYVVWLMAMSATIVTGMLYRPGPDEAWGEIKTRGTFDAALLITIVIAFGLMMYFNGEAVLNPDKFEVLENIGRFFLLFSTACQIGLVAFLAQGKLVRAILPASGLLFLLYIGFRNDFALAVVALLAYFAGRKGVWIYVKLRYTVPIAAIALVLFTYKPLLYAYRAGRVDVVYSMLENENFLSNSIFGSEPFLTQSILNEVIIRDLTIAPVTILYSLVASVPFLAPLAGIRPTDLGFTFQEQLFPNLSYGVAANIYAHFYVTVGWAGVILFILAHNWALVRVSKGMYSKSPTLKLLFLGIGAFLAFYIHRNDMTNSFSSLNRLVITLLIAWGVTRFLETRQRRYQGPAPAFGGR